MNDVLEHIWVALRCRLYSPYPSEARWDEFHACVMHALHDCRAAVAQHYGLPADALTAFFKTDRTLRIAPDGPKYLVDYTWTTYPLSRWFTGGVPSPVPVPYRVLLACESEAGTWLHALEDFTKLADVQSEIKVMVYREYNDAALRRLQQQFVGFLRSHQSRHDGERWLFVGVQYYSEEEWPERVEESGVQVHILGRRDGELYLVEPAWADYGSVGPSGSSTSSV